MKYFKIILMLFAINRIKTTTYFDHMHSVIEKYITCRNSEETVQQIQNWRTDYIFVNRNFRNYCMQHTELPVTQAEIREILRFCDENILIANVILQQSNSVQIQSPSIFKFNSNNIATLFQKFVTENNLKNVVAFYTEITFNSDGFLDPKCTAPILEKITTLGDICSIAKSRGIIFTKSNVKNNEIFSAITHDEFLLKFFNVNSQILLNLI